jgi:small-conductance mechanosensitive channel
VLSRDYNQYMDIQQSIYLAIHEGFEAEGIEFAYPTQTLFLEHPDGVKTADT